MGDIKTIIKKILMHDICLETERLMLRKITAQDKQAIFEYASDPDVTKNLRFETHRSLVDTEAFLAMVRTWYAGLPEDISLAIEHKHDRKLIGLISFVRFEFDIECAELGYVLSKKYWGQGYAPEAAKKFIEFGFSQLKLHRIEALVKTINTRSLRVLEKVGMQQEGLLRGKLKKDSTYFDAYMYSIIKNEEKKGKL